MYIYICIYVLRATRPPSSSWSRESSSTYLSGPARWISICLAIYACMYVYICIHVYTYSAPLVRRRRAGGLRNARLLPNLGTQGELKSERSFCNSCIHPLITRILHFKETAPFLTQIRPLSLNWSYGERWSTSYFGRARWWATCMSIHLYTYIYIYVYIHICVCICIYMYT